MRALPIDEIRASFLEFFRAGGHEVVSSSPLVPANDPTLLFTNAGMVQFKDVFTGKEKRPYVRAASAQKCVRAGGKHNDLENVGYTARHHTFFEMLGNFSFGDYFKKEAIEYAWALVTDVFGIPKERLAVTVFKGEGDIPPDEEAARAWEAAGVPRERIFWLGKADNYWQMGDTGPQGPCSEIHFFAGNDPENMLAPGRVERSDGWLEIWNLVFMQFQKDAPDAPLVKLPKPSIDTGAGLERLAMVLQSKSSNYDTDAFKPMIEALAGELRKTYGGSMAADDVSMRVVADHSRATAFLIADGVQPSNEGRGYVLRRIMRRAIRHGSRIGFSELFFHRACQRVVDRMKGVYPELARAASLIGKVAESEEAAFRRTLDRGMTLLEDEMRAQEEKKVLEPEFVARLYHTYGFPIDLTRVIASERGFAVDEDAAREAVVRSNPEQAKAELGGGEQAIERVWYEIREEVGPTEFVGYERDDCEAKVLALVATDGRRVAKAGKGEKVQVVLDRTPMYGEAGGQVGDRGRLEWKGLAAAVRDTTKPRPELHVHHAEVLEGEIAVGERVEVKTDARARDATRKNHSATHLLHLALKEVLGSHVQQKGSLVAPDRLRFDYAHFEAPTAEHLEAIERRVNELVLRNAPTETEEGPIARARDRGAVMLFGEKYGDRVRMVQIGGDSLELCGGTHVRRSGDIGLVKIISDVAIAAGVRRMEAVTGLGALEWAQKQARLLGQASAVLRAAPETIPERIEKLVKRSKELERELERAKAEAALGGGSSGGPGGSGRDLLDKVEDIGGVRVLVHRADGTPAKALRDLSDKLRDRIKSGVVVLGTGEGEKAAVLVAVTKDLAGRVHAGEVVKAAAAAMAGSGGGRPDFAQGGGKPELLDAALARVREFLRGAAGEAASRATPE